MTRNFLAAVAVLFSAHAATATDAIWNDIQLELYGERTLLGGDHLIAIDAPYRTFDDARTQLAAQVTAADGTLVDRVTLVLDENPMPVSAVFELDKPQTSFFFDITMRVNGPTPLHVVAEMADGRLFVAETFVKTSGQGACAAPPGTDVDEALANLGKMRVDVVGRMPVQEKQKAASLLDRMNKMDVDISHPSHSGMQMDQISLLFIPMRYVETVEIDLDGAGYVDMTGSISLSENPRVSLSVPSRSQSVDVTMTDTDGTVSHLHKKLPGF